MRNVRLRRSPLLSRLLTADHLLRRHSQFRLIILRFTHTKTYSEKPNNTTAEPTATSQILSRYSLR